LIYLKLVVVMLFWAGGFIATRVAAQTFGPFTGAFLRYLLACVLLVPMTLRNAPGLLRVDRRQILRLCLLGFSGVFAYNYFFFNGLKLVPASHGALVVALNPAMVMLFSAWRYGEPVKGLRLLGLLLSMAGVAFVISRGHPTRLLEGFEWGDAFMLGCPITWAVYTLVGREALRSSTPTEATTWASVTGALMLLLFALFEEQPVAVPFEAWVSLAYLGIIGTVLAFIWFYEGVGLLGASRAAIFNNLIPVFTLVLSVLILDEEVPSYTYAGAALVLTGVTLVNWKGWSGNGTASSRGQET
jgi:drug/metabolite transporter (DMT)-like permease